jgi:hypothetical protein
MGKKGVESGCGMAFAEYKTVAIRPFRIFRIMSHHIAKEACQEVDGGKRTARMAGLGFIDHFQDIDAKRF